MTTSPTTIPTSVANEGERERLIEQCAQAVEGLRREVPYEYNSYPCSTTMRRAAAAIRALSPALDNTAVEGQECTAKAIRSATALAEIVEDVLEWGGAPREHDLQVAYDQLTYDLAALAAVQTEKAR